MNYIRREYCPTTSISYQLGTTGGVRDEGDWELRRLGGGESSPRTTVMRWPCIWVMQLTWRHPQKSIPDSDVEWQKKIAVVQTYSELEWIVVRNRVVMVR